ncbi:MAG: Si-specific NAD(P)(+) transhydrogenase [Blastocatellia bacterium]|nr:Si-specific NAD(P)(+) transhydrogenase [Blastocatellia bacterium]
MEQYDLAVIGSGPAGEKAAVKAAYFGLKVAIIEKAPKVGGAGILTGTLPSKTLKETALYFSGKADRGLYGVDRQFTRETSVEDFMFRKNFVTTNESDQMHDNLVRHKVDVYFGKGSFVDQHTIRVTGETETTISARYILISTGSYPFHPDNIPFDGVRVHDSDTILTIERFPKTLAVIGAGVIGCEYATIFATMGTKVYLVNYSDAILPFLDSDVTQSLVEKMSKDGVAILFKTSFESVEVPADESQPIRIPLKSGEVLEVDMFLYAAGRCGSTKGLNCEGIGVNLGPREVVQVDQEYRTSVPHIFAVGDVIGFPALASTSMEQGREAVGTMFNVGDMKQVSKVYPFAIYTIPEVSMVGLTEDEAKKQGLSYCTGVARYQDMPRGKIMGVQDGILKLVFNREDLVICGVHMMGNLASELIHYGLTLVQDKKTLRDVISTIFNFPTLHELYKYACYDGLGNLAGHKLKK